MEAETSPMDSKANGFKRATCSNISYHKDFGGIKNLIKWIRGRYGHLVSYEKPQLSLFPRVQISSDKPSRWPRHCRRELAWNLPNGFKGQRIQTYQMQWNGSRKEFSTFYRVKISSDKPSRWPGHYRRESAWNLPNGFKRQWIQTFRILFSYQKNSYQRSSPLSKSANQQYYFVNRAADQDFAKESLKPPQYHRSAGV